MDVPGLFRSLVLVNLAGRASALDAACGSGSREQWFTTRPPNASMEYMWEQFLWSAGWLSKTVFPAKPVPDLDSILGLTDADRGIVLVTATVNGVRVVWQAVKWFGVPTYLVVVDPSVYPINRNEVTGLLVLCSLPLGKFEDLAQINPSVVILDTVAPFF
jgi:hypothetical protein